MFVLAALFIFLSFGWADPAFALQEHPPPEGLIAHQLAHLFFAGAMVVFAYRLRLSGLAERPHWRYLKWAAYSLAFWNVWALGGHIFTRLAAREIFLSWQEGLHYCYRWLRIEGPLEFFYFVFKNDNVFALAAFYLLYRGLSRLEALLKEGGE
ncbi:MAG: hypothetical protein GXO17_04280 [Thermodesulfobacteria bacterium]|nr:hypothetical protein [Thermodesulfobacteriota bacterium]